MCWWQIQHPLFRLRLIFLVNKGCLRCLAPCARNSTDLLCWYQHRACSFLLGFYTPIYLSVVYDLKFLVFHLKTNSSLKGFLFQTPIFCVCMWDSSVKLQCWRRMREVFFPHSSLLDKHQFLLKCLWIYGANCSHFSCVNHVDVGHASSPCPQVDGWPAGDLETKATMPDAPEALSQQHTERQSVGQ